MKIRKTLCAFLVIFANTCIFNTYAVGKQNGNTEQIRNMSEQTQENDEKIVKVEGKIIDTKGKEIPGVTILIENTFTGTSSDSNGRFAIDVRKGDKLKVSFLGMKTQTVTVTSSKITITLEEDLLEMDKVVVTGIFNRRTASFTGASKTISSEDLKLVGNQNIIQSLKNLDPSLFVIDNLDLGSDPNAVPELQMRGMSSIGSDAVTSLKGNYQSKPNQPLFILDGFEASVEKIFDLDMNRIQSITLLKDASAKAIYGSKAANGVVVVETKQMNGSEMIVTYTGSIDITMPDLTSYNLANASEKLEVERIEGVYENTNFPDQQVELWQLYEKRKKLIADGLDTDWI